MTKYRKKRGCSFGARTNTRADFLLDFAATGFIHVFTDKLPLGPVI